MAQKLVLGLDIGVASVGWGIVDKTSGKIIDKGVRLFSSNDPENNVDRRNFRHTRRLIRRKEFRLYRTRRVLLNANIIKDISFMPLNNPYHIRCKGLHEKLTNDELATGILHLMKRNGYRYDIAEEKEDSGISKISEEYLCEHQLKLLLETGQVRGTENKYHYSLYEKEFIKLLDTQKVDSSVKTKLLDIFKTRRDFSEGPGSANSPSIYGRYLSLNSEPINLIEKMRGKCSVYPDEPRAPMVCPSAELFNFLNDINNLTIDGNHISQEKKNDILEQYILGKGKITIKQLADFLGTSEANISGFRLHEEKPILTPFTSLTKIKDATKKAGLPNFEIESFDDFYLLDTIFEILTSTKIVEKRIVKLSDIQSPKLNKQYIDCFARITGVSQYHSLSLKAIREITNEMLVTSKNSQQVIVTLDTNSNEVPDLTISKNVVMSPVVRKSANQAFRIIKAIRKKYGELESILIEMPREKNLEDEKRAIKNSQKIAEENKKTALEIIGENSNVEPKKSLIEKVLLYKEQEGKSIYSGKPIDLKQMINDPKYTEVDHIIPYSVSFDDSRNNRVVVLSSENQHKGNRTPMQAFSDKPTDWQSWSDFEAIVKTSQSLSRTKKDNLLYAKDIRSEESMEEFSSRNLNDTRYACRLVLNTLKNYLKYNEINTKVFVINGKTTNIVRHMANLVKDRNFHCHHAVDACIIASFSQSTYLSNILNKQLYDEETGEIYSLKEKKEIFGPIVESVTTQLHAFDPIKDFKFSYQVDKKANRSISDQTLYGTRYIDGNLRVVKKYKNIYDKCGEDIADFIRKNDTKKIERLLIVKNDPKTFALLSKIVANYPNEKNPFAAYLKDEGHPIHKVSKKDKKAPPIYNLEYVEDKVNIALDLSSKYKTTKNYIGSPVKLQLSSYRMDLYKSSSGKYRFLSVRYADIKTNGKIYWIPKEIYNKLKEDNKIDSSYKFVNSFYRNDLIERSFSDDTKKLELYKCVASVLEQKFELSYYAQETTRNKDGEIKKFQYIQILTKNCIDVKKYSTDILGNLYQVKDEPLKLEW